MKSSDIPFLVHPTTARLIKEWPLQSLFAKALQKGPSYLVALIFDLCYYACTPAGGARYSERAEKLLQMAFQSEQKQAIEEQLTLLHKDVKMGENTLLIHSEPYNMFRSLCYGVGFFIESGFELPSRRWDAS